MISRSEFHRPSGGSNSNNDTDDRESIYENGMGQLPRTSTWRNTLQQALIILGANLHSMSVGMAMGFPTVVIAHLHGFDAIWTLAGEKFKIFVGTKDEDKEITYNDDQASWHGSLALTSILLGSLVASAVQPRFGRRTVLNVANIFLVIAWSLTSVALQPALILASSTLTSFYAGSLVAPNIVYQMENFTSKSLRSTFLLPLNHISLMLGMVIEMGMGVIIYWRNIAAINAIFPGLGIFIVFMLPQNSSQQHQNKESNSPFTSNTENESPNCTSKVDHYDTGGEQTSANLKTSSNNQSTSRSYDFKSAALLTASLCYPHFCGLTVIRTYSTSLLAMLSVYGLPVFIHVFPFILSCIQISGVCFGLALRFWSERSCKIPLLLASYVGSTGSCLALSFYSHFHVHKSTVHNQNEEITSAIPAWLPSVLLGIHSFASCMSIPLVPYSFAGEFFPEFSLQLKSRFALILSCTACFLGNKFFFSIVHLVGVKGFFWVHSLTGFICAGLICALIPRNIRDDDEIPTRSSWHHTSEDLNDTKLDISSISGTGSEDKYITQTSFNLESGRGSISLKKNNNAIRASFKAERNSITREVPDWLGDISWAGRHGGWLIEEKRKGGWRVIERGYKHENGGGRSMDVESGTWIGHMIHTITKAAIEEESKDIARWKLANRSKKRWIITRGPKNEWQICSAPWETDTSEESEDSHESDDTDTADGTKSNEESSNSDDTGR
ncbi:uncharacterized protein LOC124171638 [Ischnura elegans]|uniref:uncharacterized protein LOC124171638 n=1 Tax=Ischnura elegans TaxID=197161 RepID=UPI001ED89546|nr:uncharacterized protein LOC124171638 [Ischnura elegans]